MVAHTTFFDHWEGVVALGIFGIIGGVVLIIFILSFVKDIIKTHMKRYAHLENIERMKNGYPPLDIAKKAEKKAEKSRHGDDVIDMTGSAQSAKVGNEN